MTRRRTVRPSLLLWRWRHLVVAACVAAASLLVLALLRPPPAEGREVLVVDREVSAGEVIQPADLTHRVLPEDLLPQDDLATEAVVGSRAAVGLVPGTVLTGSMTSAADAAGLSADEQLVQVPVGVGAGLAQPGAHVDVVSSAPSSACLTTAPAPATEGPEPPELPGAAMGTESAGNDGTGILARGARVLRVEPVDDSSQFNAGTKVTLVTLAVPRHAASLVVGAATRESLGLVMSPA